jgi:hypothetical protein
MDLTQRIGLCLASLQNRRQSLLWLADADIPETLHLGLVVDSEHPEIVMPLCGCPIYMETALAGEITHLVEHPSVCVTSNAIIRKASHQQFFLPLENEWDIPFLILRD